MVNSSDSFRQLGDSNAPPPTPGWVRLTSSYFDKLEYRRNLSDYFDGSSPDWRDVIHPSLQARPFVNTVIKRFENVDLADRSRLLLVLGASGEGKSTVLLQSSMRLMNSGLFEAIYWRTSPTGRLTEESQQQLRSYYPSILFVADDAETLISDLDQILRRPSDGSASKAHYMLTARDTDWIAEARRLKWRGAPTDRWQATIGVLPSIAIEAMSREDARIVAQNWIACAPSLPDNLQSVSASALESKLVSNAEESGKRTAFLGALLATRLGENRLKFRLQSLLEKVSEYQPGGKASLADLLTVLAIIDVCGIDGLPRDLVAEFLAIEESGLRPLVEVPLRREFFLGVSGTAMFSRHPMISRALMQIVLGQDSAVLTGSVVTGLLAAVKVVAKRTYFRPGFGKIIDIGRRLSASDFSLELIGDVSLGACRESCALFPEMLSNFIGLSLTLRSTGQEEAALREVWQPISSKLDEGTWVDTSGHLRGSWHEFATVLSLNGFLPDAFWADMVSLSDRVSVPLTAKNVILSLNGLALVATIFRERFGPDPMLSQLVTQVEALLSTPNSVLYDGMQYASRYLTRLGLRSTPFKDAQSLATLITTTEAFLYENGTSLSWITRLHGQTDLALSAFIQFVSSHQPK